MRKEDGEREEASFKMKMHAEKCLAVERSRPSEKNESLLPSAICSLSTITIFHPGMSQLTRTILNLRFLHYCHRHKSALGGTIEEALANLASTVSANSCLLEDDELKSDDVEQ
jgi:hypothetical protein